MWFVAIGVAMLVMNLAGIGPVGEWAWAGFGLLLVGSLAWGFAQRRRRLAPVARSTVLGDAPSSSRAAELAAVMPAPAAEPVATEPTPVLEPVIVPAAAPAKPAPKPAPAPAPVKASGPTWHSGGAPAATQAPAAAPAGRDRLELAVAYLDLGDVATARDLLNEVAAGADAGARDEALQLLREIG